MFELYPYLGFPKNQPAAHAAFIAGYICHLWLDVLWVRDGGIAQITTFGVKFFEAFGLPPVLD